MLAQGEPRMRDAVGRTMTVRFSRHELWRSNAQETPGVLAPGASAFDAPSAWLFLIRLHACRAGLRFTRQGNCSSIFVSVPVRWSGRRTFPYYGRLSMHERLQKTLKQLRLSGLAQSLEVRLQEAASHQLNNAELLELILQDEILVRGDRQFQRRLKAACFREQKTLEDFDWSFNPVIKKKQVFDLASGRFVREARDVLWLGPPGLGGGACGRAGVRW